MRAYFLFLLFNNGREVSGRRADGLCILSLHQQENLAELNRQEMELLEARSLPLRNYLMKNVVPSLTDAILDCCKIKVEDPVDFLVTALPTCFQTTFHSLDEHKLTVFLFVFFWQAEHLLRNNQ